jgi:hypothetical protein
MNQRSRCIAIAALLAVTCAKAPPHPAQQRVSEEASLASEVQALAERAEKLLRRQEEQVWKNWIDGTPIQMEKIYEGNQSLFLAESIQKIEKLRFRLSERYQCLRRQRPYRLECPNNPQIAQQLLALDHLHTHFVGEYLSQLLAEQNTAIANLEASLTFTAGGREHPYRDLERLLANERSPEVRRQLHAGATPAVERLSESVRRKDEKLEDLLLKLGYPSHEAFGTEIRRTDLRQLGVLADGVLDKTAEIYQRTMATLTQRELNTSFDKLRRFDFNRLFRAKALDPYFAKEGQLVKVGDTLQGMDFNLAELKNVTLDVRPLATKNPRPLSLGVAVPSDVRVSFKPIGGAHDQALLLHELGHALHYAFTQDLLGRGDAKANHPLPDIHFELSKLGNRTVNEAFALLFETLPEDPLWLEMSGVPREKVSAPVFTMAGYRLYLLRSHAGRLLYELQLHQAVAPEAKALYRRIMTRTYGVALGPDDEARYLLDRDDLYQSADELRASFLAAELRAFLVGRFGPSWWRSAEAGSFLRELWSRGTSLGPEDVAAQLGLNAVGPEALLEQISARLDGGVPNPPQSGSP